MWCACTDLFDRYVRSLREIMTQCECSLQRGNKSLSEQRPNLQDLWFPTSWLQSGNEKGWTGGSWCQSPFMGFWLLGLRASTDSSAAVQPGFRELFEELWEALAEAIPLHSGSAFNLGNCPCSLSGVLCIHAGPSHIAHCSEPDPLARTAWLDLTPALVFQDLPAVQLSSLSPGQLSPPGSVAVWLVHQAIALLPLAWQDSILLLVSQSQIWIWLLSI